MPDTRVQDEQGNIHVFPDGSTPEMMAKALGVKPPAPPNPELQPPDAAAQAHEQMASGQTTKVQPNNLMNVLAGKPLTAMQPGMSSPAQTPENATAMSYGAAVGAPVGGLISGGVRALPFIARSLVGATAGSALGGYGGKEVGGLVGHPEGGEKIGATLGGLAGGYTGARGGGVPTRSTFINKLMGLEEAPPAYVPVSKSPGSYRGPSSVPKLKAPEPELGSPENPGWMAKLPTRMPRPKASPELPGPSGSSGVISSDGQDIISRTQKLTVPDEMPTSADLKRAGDLTQAPLGRLQSLAKFGDRLAKIEIDRRSKTGILPWERAK